MSTRSQNEKKFGRWEALPGGGRMKNWKRGKSANHRQPRFHLAFLANVPRRGILNPPRKGREAAKRTCSAVAYRTDATVEMQHALAAGGAH